MKNKDIITLCNGGFLTATAHTLPTEHFYKWHKFKRAVEKANRALGEAQAALLRDCGIEPSKFSEAKPEELDRFNAANTQLLDEDCVVEVKARIPFDCYKGIYDENKTERGDIFAVGEVEAVLLDNLFAEDKEDE